MYSIGYYWIYESSRTPLVILNLMHACHYSYLYSLTGKWSSYTIFAMLMLIYTQSTTGYIHPVLTLVSNFIQFHANTLHMSCSSPTTCLLTDASFLLCARPCRLSRKNKNIHPSLLSSSLRSGPQVSWAMRVSEPFTCEFLSKTPSAP